MEILVDKIGSIHSTCLVDGIKVLERVLENCEQMLEDRGCTTVEKTNNIIESMEKNEPVLMGRNGKDINVYFVNDERVGVKFMRNVIEETSVDKIIMCSLEGPTTFTKKESEDSNIQYFLFKDLFVNITRHEIVPKHELCTENIPYSQNELPLISVNDPIIQYYDFPIGSIVKINRTFGAHEPSCYYRLIGNF
tara:strand:- start:1806 stop:2384 length:579 start_codon:yes stop_codon:yes gene_type:complete